MVQSVLFFLLGFFSAVLVVLLVAPAFWRRAVNLTRRRIEASIPLSRDEVQAEKDRIRAEFAMTQRRLEVSTKEARDKATAQMIEIDRGREELKALRAKHEESIRQIAALESKAANLESELGQRQEHLQRLAQRLGEADHSLEERSGELEKLGKLYEEASFASSNRQIEVAAREAEIEKFSTDFSQLKSQHRDTERRLQEALADAAAARDMLKSEKQRVATDEETQVRLSEAHSEKIALENEIATLRLQLATGAKGGDAGNGKTADRERQEARLVALTRENKKLREDLDAARQAHSGDTTAGADDAALREQMHQLAAEVVSLTATLDGPDSPVTKALAAKPRSTAGEGGMVSLAERIKALRGASASTE